MYVFNVKFFKAFHFLSDIYREIDDIVIDDIDIDVYI